MNEFKRSLKYEPNKGRDNKRKITGRTSIKESKRLKALEAIKRKLIVLALAGGLAVGGLGIGMAIKNAIQEKEDKYVSNLEEMEKYNITPQDLQISPELYEHVMSLSEELEQADETEFKEVSNSELADYYSEMADLYLDVLKGKVSTITGMKTSEFTLVAPSAHGSEVIGTTVKDPEMIYNVGIKLDSSEIDNYMNDILELRNYSTQITNGDVDRRQAESRLMYFKERLGEVTTLNLLKEMTGKDDVTELTSYRIETSGLQQNQTTERTTEIEKE